MMRAGITVLVLAACAPQPPAPDLKDEIEVMLRRSAAAWNAGDLEAFLSDYAADSTTSFVSGGRVHYGYDWIRDNYAPSFAPGTTRDSLRFEEIRAEPLGSEYAMATASFVLFRGDSVTGRGPFTLVLRRAAGRWRIIHDHTSRDPEPE
ncbi:MAG: YybH family protein [Gemmatimonadales bacterium]